MLHVLVETKDMGKRKAWYIGAVTDQINADYFEPVAIVVFKNNDDHQFRIVPLENVFLDTAFKQEVAPVLENSLRTINLKLKKQK